MALSLLVIRKNMPFAGRLWIKVLAAKVREITIFGTIEHGIANLITALVIYEPVIAKCTEQLLQIIESRSGNPLNITDWLKRYSFEIMGHLIFGRPFNTISEEGGDTFLLDSIHSDTVMMGYLRHMPWIPALLIKTPFFRKTNTRFWTWLETNFRHRTEVCTLPAADDLPTTESMY